MKEATIVANTETALIISTAPTIRILKIGTCPSLSGQSTLTYHIGCNAESEVYFRVHSNSSRGYFSREWVAADRVGKALGDATGITSFSLQPAYVGRSQNNGGFLLAALLAEGLVSRSADNERHYLLADPAEFNASVKALMESSVSLDADAKPKKSSKKKAASETAPLPD